MALDILELRKLCIPKNIRITLHAAKRLEQRRTDCIKGKSPCRRNSPQNSSHMDYSEKRGQSADSFTETLTKQGFFSGKI